MTAKTDEFRRRLGQGETLADIQAGLPPELVCLRLISMGLFCFIYLFFFSGAEAFAVVREAARRKLGMRHFDVQVNGSSLRLVVRKEALFFSPSTLCACGFNDRLLVGQCFMMDRLRR